MASGGGRSKLVVAAVVGNPPLARLVLAYVLMITAEFGQWLALMVYAYGRGGAGEAALVVVLQLVPSMLLAPLISAHMARVGAGRLLAGAYLAAAVTLAGCAGAILSGAPAAVVYAAAIGFSIALGVSRPMHQVLMPELVRRPAELTSANVASSWGEGAGTLAGPALGGLLISLQGPGLACAALSSLCLCAASLAAVRPVAATGEQERDGGLADLLSAARVILSRPGTRTLVAFPAGVAAIEGAIDLLVVVLAVQVLALGPGAAGYLSAAFGAGGLLGAGAAVMLVGRRLALPLAGAALLGGLALGGLALTSSALVAVLLLALVGCARTVQGVAAQTLLQRSTPLEVVVCAFALIESMRDAGTMLGVLIVPPLIAFGGPAAAFAALACLAPAAVLLGARRIRLIDGEASIPVVQMAALRSLEIFASLPPAPLEALAHQARYVTAPAGAAIVTEGEEGDSYYAVTDGSVRVTQDGRELRRLHGGAGFGEIALLHPVTRTATVTATSDATLLRVERDAFLTALGAHPAVASAAERVAAGLLGDGALAASGAPGG